MDQSQTVRHGLDAGPRYATLQDYVRVLRRQRLVVVLVTLAFGLGALVLSSAQGKVYEAVATVAFREPAQDAAVLGTNVSQQQAPAERAAYNAELITRPEVARRVQRRLESDRSPEELAAEIATEVDIRTNLVTVTAASGSPERAAELANAFVLEAKRVGDREQLGRLREAERTVERQVEQVRAAPENGPNSIRLSTLEAELARITQLLEVSEPVRVTRRATAPSLPASPRPVRNTVVGLLLGLVFGFVAAFVRDALDRRLHSAGDVHNELGMAVLGRVSDKALGYPGLVRNGRLPMSELDFEAFRVLRMNLAFLARERPARSVLVTSSGPEEGKSTVSMSLASAAALAGQRVLLVECDLRRPSFARRLGIRRAPGIADYLLGDATPADVLQTVELASPGPLGKPSNGAGGSDSAVATLVCIAAGTQTVTAAELLLSDRFGGFLDKVTKAYDLVVLDSSPLLAVSDPLEIAPRMDAVLVCARVQRTTRDQLRAARAALRNVPERPMGAVVTGLRRGGPDDEHYYYGY